MRILTLAHNHPDFHAGGTEILAWALHQHYQAQPDLEAFFVAAVDELHRVPHPGTSALSHRHRPDVALIWSKHFERLTMSQLDLLHGHAELRELVSAWQPDIIHFHHIWLLGVEAVDVVRNAAPQAKTLLTLHDFYLLCAHDGLMVKRAPNSSKTDKLSAPPPLCEQSEPNACNNCFPNITTWAFRRRALAAAAVLEQVDQLVAPSNFLKKRFVDHGVHPDRIKVIRNGLTTKNNSPSITGETGAKASKSALNLAVLGNQSQMKGSLVALQAANILRCRGNTSFHLHLHGSPALQSHEFQSALERLIEKAGATVTAHGPYTPDDMHQLLDGIDVVVMPSQWWENAPLVLEEAFAHGKPVICSNIGGMAERVDNGVNGLHFRVGDPNDLADCIERLTQNADLLKDLQQGIGLVRGIEQIADEHLALFSDLRQPPTTRRTG